MGAILLGTGFALKYMVARRRFNRRNQFGVQVFRSFGHSRLVGLVEGVAGAVGLLLMIAGAIGLVGSVMRGG